MRKIYSILLAILAMFTTTLATAQSISGIVNTYTAVTSISGAAITVSDATGFTAGEYVLIIQMTGISGGGNYGGTDNGAGNFEMLEISSVSGNVVTLASSVTKTFTPASEKVQMVKVARYTSDVTVIATLTAQNWDGATGGVIVVDAGDNDITLNADIDASGAGFFGRNTVEFSQTGPFCNEALGVQSSGVEFRWGTDVAYAGGRPGEPIALSGGTGRGGHGQCGTAPRGAPNGGAGVGGDGARSMTMTLGAGGGGGGYGGGGSSGGSGDMVDGSPAGATGTVFADSATLRLFMGATGGGEAEWGPATGNGGGIVIIRCKTLKTNGSAQNVLANGDDGPNSVIHTWMELNGSIVTYDFSSSAGGGGWVMLCADQVMSDVSVSANGGAATAQTGSTNNLANEFGGPGGGGFIISKSVLTSSSAAAGTIASGNGALAAGPGLSTVGDISGVFSDIPLPVTLTNFKAKKLGERNALLEWETASELNNEKFEIYKSVDKEFEFKYIGEVKGSGTSNSLQKYEYIDESGYPSSCYRLKQVDFDGMYEWTDISCINWVNDDIEGRVEVFPNPTDDLLNIRIPNSNFEFVAVELRDISGKLIEVNNEVRTGSTLEFNTSELIDGGIYIVRVITENSVVVQRVVVSH